MKRTQTITIAFLSFALSVFQIGCGNRFFDPTQIGRFRPTPAVNVILDSLGVAEEPPVAWEKAEDPQPSDIVAVPADYVFSSGDVIRISIFELFQEGVPFVNDFIVTETGKISIPDVGAVQAAGLTETQLEEQIKRILSPSVLKEPSVTVTLVSSQQRTFSILGDGVLAPSRYVIPRYDFRLADALATAGGPRQFNVSYIYVSRRIRDQQEIAEPVKPNTETPMHMDELKIIEPQVTEPSLSLEQQALGMITPSAQPRWPKSKKIFLASTKKMISSVKPPVKTGAKYLSTRLSTGRLSAETGLAPRSFDLAQDRFTRDLSKEKMQSTIPSETLRGHVSVEQADQQETGERIEWIFRDGKWIPIRVGPPEPTEPAIKEEVEEGVEWIFQDGRWVPVPVQKPLPPKPVIPPEEKIPEELEWEEAVKARVIKIPVAKLLAGDPRYNIVIKPGDTIHVPVDIIGEFCIMGNVNRQGYINLTGRPMTLKMAIAAAGGLGPLAWPKRCEVIRRVGENKEEIVRVDLDKIASGEQPDFFIKPNDLINVGTHATARWRAILRNAFRATYGFGFVYDRNFAYRDYYETTFNPITPWKWDGVF
ncbi:MAG: polysaccharide biosynthesis/export family protein [Sedimentisphaerales bacterium]